MKTMILFALEKRFLNKTAIILNIAIFLALGVFFHVDKLTVEKEEFPVYLDYSCSEVAVRLMNTDRIYIDDIKDIKEYHILHYENGWKLYLYGGSNETLRNKVENDLRIIRKEQFLKTADLKEKNFLEEFSRSFETEVYHHKQVDMNTVILSAVFYLILTYSNMIANELIYEKACHTLELIIGITGAARHLFSKIVTAYLSLLIQALFVTVSTVIWIFIRYAEDRLKGLIMYLNKSAEGFSLNIPTGKILMALIIIVSGLLLLQIIMLIITSCLSDSEEAAAFQNIYYILLIAVYYFFVLKGENGLISGIMSEILSFMPVISMLIMPVRLLSGTAGVIDGFLSLSITVIVTVITIEVYLHNYMRIMTKK